MPSDTVHKSNIIEFYSSSRLLGPSFAEYQKEKVPQWQSEFTDLNGNQLTVEKVRRSIDIYGRPIVDHNKRPSWLLTIPDRQLLQVAYQDWIRAGDISHIVDHHKITTVVMIP